MLNIQKSGGIGLTHSGLLVWQQESSLCQCQCHEGANLCGSLSGQRAHRKVQVLREAQANQCQGQESGGMGN